MKDRLVRYPEFCVHALGVACVRVSVVHGEAAAGDVDGDSVSCKEDVACRQEFNLVREYLAGVE